MKGDLEWYFDEEQRMFSGVLTHTLGLSSPSEKDKEQKESA